MGKYKDFKEYMEDVYYDDIFNKVKGYVTSKRDSFESDEIYQVKWVELDDIYVSGVTFKDIGNDVLEIRITVDADVDVTGKARYGYDHFAVPKCYNVFFEAVLEDGLHNERIVKIEEYNPATYERDKSLSQNLVPYMYEEDVDKHAEDFLKRHCPKALLQPMAIPVEEVVQKLGMQLYYAPLDDSVFGKTYFGKEKVVVYDNLVKKSEIEIITEPGTMLINPNVYFMYNIGTANNTIIHECVHWDRHRRPFELQKLLTGDSNHISCEIIEVYDGIPEDAPALKWMEWQANQLAPRILLPAEMFKKVYNNALRDFHTKNPRKRFAEVMEEAIGYTSNYFQVSLVATKLRLIELGYDVAHGAFVYCDGRYLPPFSFTKGSLEKNQTFIIDEKNAMFVLFMDPTLREMYCDGQIVYANNMVCLNTPKYIELNENDMPILTEYALEHVNECCFVFDMQMSASQKYSDTFYRRCFLCRDVVSETFVEATYNPEHKENQGKLTRGEELSEVVKSSKMIAQIMEEMPQAFGKTLKYHMQRLDINESELSCRSHISAQTISKYINNSSTYKKYANVVAIAKALCMNPVFMEDLIAKAGFEKKYDSVSFFVKFLIWNHPDDSVDEWQSKIKDANVDLQLPQEKS